MIIYSVFDIVGDDRYYVMSFVSEEDAHEFCVKYEKQYHLLDIVMEVQDD